MIEQEPQTPVAAASMEHTVGQVLVGQFLAATQSGDPSKSRRQRRACGHLAQSKSMLSCGRSEEYRTIFLLWWKPITAKSMLFSAGPFLEYRTIFSHGGRARPGPAKLVWFGLCDFSGHQEKVQSLILVQSCALRARAAIEAKNP